MTDVGISPLLIPDALWRPSPFADERPAMTPITLVVIHGISLPAGEWGGPLVDDLFMGRLYNTSGLPASLHTLHNIKVSAHLFIRRSGAVLQYVDLWRRAWHAGVSSWRGRERCNDFSIGIEMEGTDHHAYDERQYVSLQRVLLHMKTIIPSLEEVVGHEDIAPGRKTDPGPAWNWEHLDVPEGLHAPHCSGGPL